jgi:hypothetical protein
MISQGFKAVYGSFMIRLRQIALVAHSLDQAITDISAALDVDVIYRDPGVGFFGLHNALFCIGDQFLEVVSPFRKAQLLAGCLRNWVAMADTWLCMRLMILMHA